MKSLFSIFLLLLFSNTFSQEQFSVFFDSNKFDLKKTEIIKLNDWIAKNNLVKVIGVYGFCDEDGSTGFNDTLAKKRIDYVFNSIKTKIKFREDFKTRSFGEINNTSKIKSENRKVTLFFIQPKDFPRENEIIGIKKTEIKLVNLGIVEKLEKIKFPNTLLFENPDGTKSEIKMDTVFMKQVNESKTGEKLKLENLNFVINTFAVVNESRAKLFELFYVMKNNSKIKIEIQGHLCCAKNDKQDLSTQRAKAIYNFLVYKDISKSRLSYKGFGVSEPIFAIPEQSEIEAKTNRRVEILIVEN
jgi:outer membrane protein OmpA-like peptidoglycan-associated protein